MAQFEWTAAAIALAAVAVVLAVVAVGLIVYVMRAVKAAPAAAQDEDVAPKELAPGESAPLSEVLQGGANPDPFLMKFVKNPAGEAVGETITVHEDRLVLKKEGAFVAVPLAQVTVQDEELTTTDDVDWKDAEVAGDAWRTSREDVIEYDASGNPIPK